MINYHILFSARYRRKIFLIDGVEARTKELVHQICARNEFLLLDVNCQADYCYLHINVPPTTSAGEAVRIFKNGIAEALLKEFPAFERTQNLWTRDFYATTSPRPNKAEIERFLNLQKTQS